MPFPEVPLGVTTELQIGSVLTNVTPHTLTRNIITHSRGQKAEGQAVDPASCSLTLKSPDGLYSPRNPRSPYFEQIGLNTPMQVSVHAGLPGLDVPGAVNDYAITPDNAALDITGDIDVRVDATLLNWTDATDANDTVEFIGKLNLAAGARSWVLATRSNKLYLEWSADGTNGLSASSTVDLPLTPSGRQAVRVTLDVDNGAAGRTVTFYTAPTMAGPWTQLGATVVQAGTTSIFNSPTDLKIGDATNISFTRARGRFHKAEVRNGINGTLAASPDFTAQTAGTTSFVDSAGRTWTVNGGATISNKQIRFVGEFSDWPAEWSPRGDLITVDGNGAGILERMNQGNKMLASTLRRRIPSYSPLAYWPMEEGSDATSVYSPIQGVRAFTPTALDFAADDTLPGSSPLPVVQVGASFVAHVPSAAAGTWQVELVYNLDAMPVALTTLFEVRTTGTARRVRARVATNQVLIDGLDADDASVFSATNTAPSFTGAWNRLQIKAVQSGGNTQFVFRWVVIGGTGFSTNTTIAAVPGYVLDVRSSFGTGLDGMRFGHLAVFTTETDGPFNSADQAFNGETAGARIARLCQEESVTARVAGTVTETMPMGPQRPGTLLTLLQECADADGGIFGEERDRLGLRYRARTSLYNQTPALTLTYGQPGLARPLVPVDDTSTVRNDVTVNRVAGGSARAVLEEGRLSTQAPPDGVGLYDEAEDANLFSDDLTEPVAYWRLHLGTWDEARYPVVTVRLHKVPSLVDTVLSLTEGDLIRITNLPDWLPPGPVDLLVQGYTERMGIYTWEVDFVCVPAGPYDVGALATVSLDWVDTSGSELASAATSTATTLDVLTTADRTWTDDPSDYPWDITVGGEQVRVAAGGRLLNANPFVDTDVSGWSALSLSSMTWSTAVVHPQAAGSVLAVPTGGISSASVAQTTHSPVGSINVGASYTCSFWVYSPLGWSDFRASIDWYTSADALISTTSSSAVVVPAGAWTFVTVSGTAPATSSRAAARARQGNTPAAGDIWYAWGIRLTVAKASWLYDDFGRTVASSWGTSDSQLAWSTVGGGSASDYSVGSGYGVQVLSTVDVSRRTAVTAVHPDFDVYCDITTSALATGDTLYGAVTARMADSSNMYMARVEFTTTNTVVVTLRKMVADVQTALGTYTVPVTHVAGTFIRVRFQGRGTALKAKAWLASAVEPTVWHMEATDSALTAAGQIGTRSIRITGNTNAATVEVRYDNVNVINPQVFTVDRSRNSVVKAQTAGTDVRLAFPTRVAL